MDNRFDVLQKLPERLYVEGAPIVVEAAQLLKDSGTGKVIAQVKFRSLTSDTIKAVKLSLDAFDVTGAQLKGVEEYQYLDLAIKDGDSFGSDKAIVLPESVTRKVEITGITVVTDKELYTWEKGNDQPLEAIPESALLSDVLSANLVEQYKLETNGSATYKPANYKDVWVCTCGTVNRCGICGACGQKKDNVFGAMNEDALKKHYHQRCAEEQRRREEEQAAAEERKKKIIKGTKIAVPAVAVIAVVLLFVLYLVPDVIKPARAYSAAEKLMEAGEYDEAIEKFTEASEKKDVGDSIQECNYRKAIALKDAGDYEEAIAIWKKIASYSDSEEQIEACNTAIKYNAAVENMNEEKYEEAEKAFLELGDYNDAEKLAEASHEKYVEQMAIRIGMDSNTVKGKLNRVISSADIDEDTKSLTFKTTNSQAAVLFDLDGIKNVPNITTIVLIFSQDKLSKISIETELPSDVSDKCSETEVKNFITQEANNLGATEITWTEMHTELIGIDMTDYTGTFDIDGVQIGVSMWNFVPTGIFIQIE